MMEKIDCRGSGNPDPIFLGSGKRNREYGRGNNNNNAGRIIITMAKSGSG